MLIVGVLVLVLGVAFFVKYAFDNEWISPTLRVAAGTMAGLAMWIAGLRFSAGGYPLYGRIVAGGGLAIVYVSAYAASAFYGLVPAGVAFMWMALISGATAMTADRHRSLGLALTAIVLAFAAPFLVGSTRDEHVVFFVYDAMLAVAALGLVRRHGWPLLGPVGLCLTWATYSLWSATSFTPSVFASTEAYLTVVCAVYLGVLQTYRESDDQSSRIAAAILTVGPALYHVASIHVLSDHSLWLLVYLIVVTAIGVAIASERAAVRLIVWIAVALPLLGWVESHVSRAWYAATLATGGAVYLLHLAAQLRTPRSADDVPGAELALFHANGLGLFAFTYLAVDAHGGSTAALALFLAAANGLLAFGLQQSWSALLPHALSLAFAFAATGIALALSGPWITVAWAAEGAAVIWVGLATRREFLRFGGGMLLGVATARLVALQFGQTSLPFTPIVNSRTATGSFLVALMYCVGMMYRRYCEHLDSQAAATGRDAAIVVANVLTVGLLTADIYSYWLAREAGLAAHFGRELTISLTWAAYGMGLIALGFMRGSTTLRYLALVLFGVTIVKMFTIDLQQLGGIYRITGFIVLGIVLLAASFLYQRFQSRLASADPT